MAFCSASGTDGLVGAGRAAGEATSEAAGEAAGEAGTLAGEACQGTLGLGFRV